MHAFIIAHPDRTCRQKTLNHQLSLKLEISKNKLSNHPDIKYIQPETTSISIKSIRELKSWLYQKPFSLPKKAAVIKQAQTLTTAAQNAFLKCLEEPPQNTYLFLITTNPNLLLNTITSRCQLIATKAKDSPSGSSGNAAANGKTSAGYRQASSKIEEIGAMTPGQRIHLAVSHSKNRDQALDFCQNLLVEFRSNLKNPQIIITAIKQLKTNTNPKLTLENLLLNL